MTAQDSEERWMPHTVNNLHTPRERSAIKAEPRKPRDWGVYFKLRVSAGSGCGRLSRRVNETWGVGNYGLYETTFSRTSPKKTKNQAGQTRTGDAVTLYRRPRRPLHDRPPEVSREA